jgi:DNA-directed RNA polymerase subunit K/omega
VAVSGYDTLLELTDSRYRLSTIAAKRAAQLKKGFPTTLVQEEYPKNRDGVSKSVVAVALQELLLHKGIVWGETLPSDAELMKVLERDKQVKLQNYSVTIATPESGYDEDDV